MNDEICWLVTLLCNSTNSLIRCALKIKYSDLPGDCYDCPMEPENRKFIHSLLPLHVQECGLIVDVRTLFEIHIATVITNEASPPPERPQPRLFPESGGCGKFERLVQYFRNRHIRKTRELVAYWKAKEDIAREMMWTGGHRSHERECLATAASELKRYEARLESLLSTAETKDGKSQRPDISQG